MKNRTSHIIKQSKTYQIQNKSQPKRVDYLYENQDDLDMLITKLRSEIFEKQQNGKDYNALEGKFLQLKNDISIISKEKLRLQNELAQSINKGKEVISTMQTENENLKQELNEKNLANKKLYEENNNIYQALEAKTLENKDLHGKICDQEEMIQGLDLDKKNLENAIYSLDNVIHKQENDIQTLKNQLNLLNKESGDLNSEIDQQNLTNNKIISDFNEEKNINDSLLSQLKQKEYNINQLNQELANTNENLNQLEQELNDLTDDNNNVKDEIVKINNEYLKENAIRNQTENNNKKLGDMINERDIKINKISDDNNFVKKNNVNSTNICNDLNNKVEVYKKHILTITEQNSKLSQELENILSRDDQVIYQLNRAEYLRHVEEENKNIINASLDSLKKHLNKFGNMGNRLDKSNVIKINSMNNRH